MTLNALIGRLTALCAEHGGDLPVIVDDGDFDTPVDLHMVRFGYDVDGNESLVIDVTEA